MRDVITFILAGGKGERLNPLTRDRAKPAVPFGGIYRIIDFTLSNCSNSGLRKIYVLIQYKSFSLQKHLLMGWNIFSSELGEFIDVIPAQQRISSNWYKGTADAIYQNIYTILDHNPQLVLILAGDHIYKMDYRKLIDYHQKMDADMTVSCVQMPKEKANSFGVIEVDDKKKVKGFQEKPIEPKTLPNDSHQVFASLGIYIFKREVLLEELKEDAHNETSEHDFGKNVISQMLQNKRKVYVYNFIAEDNRPQYWRDIGTRDAYYEANMDLVQPHPEFDLFDKNWRVRTYQEQFPPVKVITHYEGIQAIPGSIEDSLISGGCVLIGAHVKRSILSPDVTIEEHAQVDDSVLMEGVVVGKYSKIRKTIIDKEVKIPPYSQIGYDRELDRKRFDVTTSGIIMVAKKASIQ